MKSPGLATETIEMPQLDLKANNLKEMSIDGSPLEEKRKRMKTLNLTNTNIFVKSFCCECNVFRLLSKP